MPVDKNRIEGGAEQGERATDLSCRVSPLRTRMPGGVGGAPSAMTGPDPDICASLRLMPTPAALAPLKDPVFRGLWLAWLAANMTMWMNDVAAAWLSR